MSPGQSFLVWVRPVAKLGDSIGATQPVDWMVPTPDLRSTKEAETNVCRPCFNNSEVYAGVTALFYGVKTYQDKGIPSPLLKITQLGLA